MDPATPSFDARRMYDDVVARAFGHASRRVPRAEALEVAHDVACVLVRRRLDGLDDPGDARSYEGLIYRAVWNRLNDLKRGADRRAAAERVHLDERTRAEPAWAAADGAVIDAELSRLVQDAIAEMPAAMRDAFLLVRQEELSYKEAAARLGVGVGTVHTQLARATQRLRRIVARYRAGTGTDADREPPTNVGRNPR